MSDTEVAVTDLISSLETDETVAPAPATDNPTTQPSLLPPTENANNANNTNNNTNNEEFDDEAHKQRYFSKIYDLSFYQPIDDQSTNFLSKITRAVSTTKASSKKKKKKRKIKKKIKQKQKKQKTNWKQFARNIAQKNKNNNSDYDDAAPVHPRKDYNTLSGVKLFTINDLLTADECAYYMSETNRMGYSTIEFEYQESYRSCERIVCNCKQLSDLLWTRLIPYFERRDVEHIHPYGYGHEGIWRPTHINEVLRFTRYRNGDFFEAHRDGGFVRNNRNRSVYTLMVYLNDDSEGDFTNGETVFYDSTPENYSKLYISESELQGIPKLQLKPVKGQAVIFNHDCWHKGEKVVIDTLHQKRNCHKHILRTDIMFECFTVEAFDEARLAMDPLYLKAEELYDECLRLQNLGQPKLSTEAYLKALAINSQLPTLMTSNAQKPLSDYGAEFAWFNQDLFDLIFKHLSLRDLTQSVAHVSHAFHYLMRSPSLWKNLYQLRFGAAQIACEKQTTSAVIHPWVQLFKYRQIIGDQYPILCFSFAFANAIEIGVSHKKFAPEYLIARPDDDSDNGRGYRDYYRNAEYHDHHRKTYAQLTHFDACLVPLAYGMSRRYGWMPGFGSGGVVIGSTVFAAPLPILQKPEWVVDEHGCLGGLTTLCNRLLNDNQTDMSLLMVISSLFESGESMDYIQKQILNVVNNQHSSYGLNSAESVMKNKIAFKNAEEMALLKYHESHGVVIIADNRSFVITPIFGNQRLFKYIKKFIAGTTVYVANEIEIEDRNPTKSAMRFNKHSANIRVPVYKLRPEFDVHVRKEEEEAKDEDDETVVASASASAAEIEQKTDDRNNMYLLNKKRVTVQTSPSTSVYAAETDDDSNHASAHRPGLLRSNIECPTKAFVQALYDKLSDLLFKYNNLQQKQQSTSTSTTTATARRTATTSGRSSADDGNDSNVDSLTANTGTAGATEVDDESGRERESDGQTSASLLSKIKNIKAYLDFKRWYSVFRGDAFFDPSNYIGGSTAATNNAGKNNHNSHANAAVDSVNARLAACYVAPSFGIDVDTHPHRWDQLKYYDADYFASLDTPNLRDNYEAIDLVYQLHCVLRDLKHKSFVYQQLKDASTGALKTTSVPIYLIGPCVEWYKHYIEIYLNLFEMDIEFHLKTEPMIAPGNRMLTDRSSMLNGGLMWAKTSESIGEFTAIEQTGHFFVFPT